MEVKDRPLCRNQAEIGDFIGVDKKSVPYLIKKHDLPAWKIEGKGPWKALKSSLLNWLEHIETKFLEK